jgi:hypothetical protein
MPPQAICNHINLLESLSTLHIAVKLQHTTLNPTVTHFRSSIGSLLHSTMPSQMSRPILCPTDPRMRQPSHRKRLSNPQCSVSSSRTRLGMGRRPVVVSQRSASCPHTKPIYHSNLMLTIVPRWRRTTPQSQDCFQVTFLVHHLYRQHRKSYPPRQSSVMCRP